ncbi:MAG: efflux RND transporter periplasmic adaptor subunit [Bryobacteraceae bacterium]
MAARKKRSVYWIVAVLVPCLAAVAFLSLRALSRTPSKIDSEKLARVERMDLARSVVATGKIQPTTQVEIKSKASGIILKLPVNVGDVVRQGEIICELDQNDLQPKLRQAQAALGMADAMLKSAQADYERNKVEAAGPDIPFLKKDVDRARQMFQEMLVPQTARDDAEKNYQMALNRQQRWSTWGSPKPPFARPRPRWSRIRPNWRNPKRTCATPRSCHLSTAWCSRATARWATRSAPSW